jgi:hypothetical protein
MLPTAAQIRFSAAILWVMEFAIAARVQERGGLLLFCPFVYAVFFNSARLAQEVFLEADNGHVDPIALAGPIDAARWCLRHREKNGADPLERLLPRYCDSCVGLHDRGR